MDFFHAAKLIWFVIQPSNFGLLLLAASVTLQFTRFKAAGRVLGALTLACAVLVISLPIGQWLAAPLENRFSRPPWPPRVDGILVLGGGGATMVSTTRGWAVYASGEGAIVAAVELARRYPQAKLVFSGGSPRVLNPGPPETAVARQLFEQLGVPLQRVIFEDQSRNTWENFAFSRALVHPRTGEVWVLVTTALHMPRSMGIARRVGWQVVPWPTDYTTPAAGSGPSWRFDFKANLQQLDEATKEWIGLVGYRFAGKTDELFPSQ